MLIELLLLLLMLVAYTFCSQWCLRIVCVGCKQRANPVWARTLTPVKIHFFSPFFLPCFRLFSFYCPQPRICLLVAVVVDVGRVPAGKRGSRSKSKAEQKSDERAWTRGLHAPKAYVSVCALGARNWCWWEVKYSITSRQATTLNNFIVSSLALSFFLSLVAHSLLSEVRKSSAPSICYSRCSHTHTTSKTLTYDFSTKTDQHKEGTKISVCSFCSFDSNKPPTATTSNCRRRPKRINWWTRARSKH